MSGRGNSEILTHSCCVRIAFRRLIDAAGNPVTWPRADVIISNPPFLGAKRLKPERGPDYVNAVRRAYPDVQRGSALASGFQLTSYPSDR